MKIDVDRDRCEGHGLCEEQAPELFRLDDDGMLVFELDGQDVPAQHEDAARAAVMVCPLAALRHA